MLRELEEVTNSHDRAVLVEFSTGVQIVEQFCSRTLLLPGRLPLRRSIRRARTDTACV